MISQPCIMHGIKGWALQTAEWQHGKITSDMKVHTEHSFLTVFNHTMQLDLFINTYKMFMENKLW